VQLDALRAVLRVVCSGLASRAEVDEWSIGKIMLWSRLVDEEELARSVRSGAGMWDAKQVNDACNRGRSELLELFGVQSPDVEWEPWTRARLIERMKARGQL